MYMQHRRLALGPFPPSFPVSLPPSLSPSLPPSLSHQQSFTHKHSALLLVGDIDMVATVTAGVDHPVPD